MLMIQTKFFSDLYLTNFLATLELSFPCNTLYSLIELNINDCVQQRKQLL